MLLRPPVLVATPLGVVDSENIYVLAAIFLVVGTSCIYAHIIAASWWGISMSTFVTKLLLLWIADSAPALPSLSHDPQGVKALQSHMFFALGGLSFFHALNLLHQSTSAFFVTLFGVGCCDFFAVHLRTVSYSAVVQCNLRSYVRGDTATTYYILA
ncbi:hypothetical protein HMN09_00896600 [Mycena chlorophos]|uniref:Uncharacterized protein n=1 Tax=Mycena chlorophos TaxID=658473 RepID=A0A8H6SPZ0_MYCCL|nr:hypothetical protein HMN09_00896600 [Mycena chlorophos]